MPEPKARTGFQFLSRWILGMGLVTLAASAAEARPPVAVINLYSFNAFKNYVQGFEPEAGVILGQEGSLFGVTVGGGDTSCFGESVGVVTPSTPASDGCGVVFRLAPNKNGMPTKFEVIHVFAPKNDGINPTRPLVQDKGENLFGVTRLGGQMKCSAGNLGCGVVFEEIAPDPGQAWRHKIVHVFKGGTKDGAFPDGELVLDRKSGVLYGTTCSGGKFGNGSVFQLTPKGGNFDFALIHSFTGGDDGNCPEGNLAFDHAGNLYGVTVVGGGENLGVVFRLSPTKHGWRATGLYSFNGGSGDGQNPRGGVALDHSGNLFGATQTGGSSGDGVIYELSPSGVTWTETILHNFTDTGSDGADPNDAKLAIDGVGNIFGATSSGGGADDGTLFELVNNGGGSYIYETLYEFCAVGSCVDGVVPVGGVILTEGILYGTTAFGGTRESGNAFAFPGAEDFSHHD